MFNRKLCLLLVPLALMLGCSSSSSDGDTVAIISTNGGSLTTGTGSITVRVVDACNGAVIADAWVWINSDIANAIQTNSSGIATLTNVTGTPNERMISAGKDTWSIASILTTATDVNLGLLRTDVTTIGQTTTVSGTVNFLGAQGSATVFAINDDDDVGFTSDIAVNSGGSGTYSISVPTGRDLILAAATVDGDGTLTAIDVLFLNSLTTAVTNANFDVPAAATPSTLNNGVVSGILTGHDGGSAFASGELRWGGVELESQSLVISSNSATVTNFQLPDSSVGSNTNLVLAGTIGAFSSASGNAEFSEFVIPQGLLSAFPNITMPSGSLTLTVGAGSTPTVTWTSSLTGTTGFHEVVFDQSVSTDRRRTWTFYVSGSTGSFTVPTVPASLTDEGLVTGQTYTVTAEAKVTSVADFDNLSLSNTLESTSRSLFGDVDTHTP